MNSLTSHCYIRFVFIFLIDIRYLMYHISFFLDTDTCIMRELSMRPFVVCLPAWFRLAQCLRRYRDTKETFPHLLNAIKYATSFFVVIFSYLHLTNKSKFFLQLTYKVKNKYKVYIKLNTACFSINCSTK